MKFCLKKSLLDQGYKPDLKFDWRLGPGENFIEIDPNDEHSSISSCNIEDTEQ